MRKLNQQGFNLMELMIVVVILGVIAAIALPSYNAYVIKSRRSDGYSAMNEIMQAQERMAVRSGTYTTNLANLGYTVTGGCVVSEEEYYCISAAACDGAIAACVVLTADARNGQESDTNDNGALDPGDMSFNSRGVKVGWK